MTFTGEGAQQDRALKGRQEQPCLCGCGKKFKPRTLWHSFATPKCKARFNRSMNKLGRETAQNNPPAAA